MWQKASGLVITDDVTDQVLVGEVKRGKSSNSSTRVPRVSVSCHVGSFGLIGSLAMRG